MLKILDRYIIKKYLASFFFTILIFTLIAVIIDFSERIEKFIEEPVTIREIIFDYYGTWIPNINGLLLPLYALIAVIFFTSRLAFNSEVISILNAGVSFGRLMRPYMIAACFMAGMHLVGNHYVIPDGNKTRLEFEHTYVWKDSDKGKTKNVHLLLSEDTKAYIRYFSKRDTTARDMRIERFEGNNLVYLLKAPKAQWLGPPNNWRLQNYEIRTFNGMQETLEIGRGKHIDTTLNLTPADFVWFANEKEMLTTPELREQIAYEKSRGIGNSRIFEIEIHRRTAEPFTILILTLIGVAVAARRVRGGMGLHLAIGIGLGAIFIFLSKFAITFATNESLPTILGVWIPNILFSFVAAILVWKAQK